MGPVRFIDDSKGTNVDATLAALSAFDEPVVVILGGDGKGQRFERLANRVHERRIQAICIGRDGPTIAQMLEAKGCQCHRADSLEAAVEIGWTLAQSAAQESGRSVLLLSPACASFDMFTGYAHRARVFSEAVAALAAREGQPC
jgi:UDP-N-acetylmuramoylalanine--D-glutamate ligase